MSQQIVSNKRAKALGSCLFLIGLAAVAATDTWWPYILLVIGVSLALRQFLTGKLWDSLLSLLVFGGIFVTYQFETSWQVIFPVIFILAALYIFIREFIVKDETEEEKEEDLNHEIEEEKEEK